MSTELPYLVGTSRPYAASYLLFRKGNEIAMLLRTNTGWMDGNYSLPAGRVDEGESPSRAAVREAQEEVRATIKPEDMQVALTLHRYSSSDDTIWVDAYFAVQKWEGELVNAEPHKHGEVTWFPMDDLPQNIVPAVRFALEQINDGKTYAEWGWNPTETE